MRRELGIASLNKLDVERGLDRLKGSGYLGSGPAFAWSSSAPPPAIEARDDASQAAVVALAAAKRAVDLPFRMRSVDFDQLIPLLLDPVR